MPITDEVDLQLLVLLQENGRVSQNDLAKSVGLSAPAVGERLRKLEERGVIRRFAAVLDPQALGHDITAFLFVGMAGSRHYPEFRSRVAALPQVQECHSVTGQGSHLLKIRVRNTAALERLLAEIQAWPGVQGTNTSIVLSTLKETTTLPLPDPESDAGDDDTLDDSFGPAELLRVPFRHNP